MLEDLFVGADSPIKGQVDTFADLPATAELGDLFVVKTTTGVIGVNRKVKGLYRWDGAAWVFADGIEANKVIYNNADSSLTSGTVKAAIDELDTKRQDASNLTSGTIAEARLPAIDADNTTITNLEVDNLKTGVLDTDLTTVSANDDTLASAKAIKAYVDANAGGVDPRDSFTQNAGQYIGTEGIRARDVGGIAMMNDDGTAGVTVADNGDVDIITKMTASEIKARNVNGLKLHDDGGTGLLVKDGGDVEVDTKIISSEIKAKDANGLKLHDDGGNGLIVKDGGATDATHLITSSGGIKAKGNPGTSFYADTETSVNMGTLNNNYGFIEINSSHGEGGWIDFTDASGSDFKGRLRYINSGNRMEFYSNSLRRMVLDSNGRFGIDTQTPTEKLDVNGNATISGQLGVGKTPSQYAVLDMEMAVTSGSGAGINLKNTASGNSYAVLNLHGNNGGVQAQYYAGGGTAVLRTYTNHGLVFGTNATERMRITNGGNVGIGTSPSAKLHVAGDIRGDRFVDNQNTGRYVEASGTSELGNLVIDSELKIRRTGFRAGSHIAMRYSTYAYPGGGNYNSVHGSLEFRAPQGWDSNDLVLTLKSEGFGNNYAQVNGNLSVSGSVSKGSGSFDIEHPDPAKKDTHRLRHYFVETPSAGGNIYKYQLDCNEGENYIDLPDYFQHLNTDSLVWANAFKHFGRAWGEVVEGGKRAKVVCEQSGTYNVLIFGDRKDKLAVDEFTKYGVEYKVDSTKEQTINDN